MTRLSKNAPALARWFYVKDDIFKPNDLVNVIDGAFSFLVRDVEKGRVRIDRVFGRRVPVKAGDELFIVANASKRP